MELKTIGRNMRRFRQAKRLRQEDLAEKTGLSTNYIGSLERGEKLPSLETFIAIANGLSVSADMLLSDVVQTAYPVRACQLAEKIAKVSPEERARIYDVLDVMLRHAVVSQTEETFREP